MSPSQYLEPEKKASGFGPGSPILGPIAAVNQKSLVGGRSESPSAELRTATARQPVWSPSIALFEVHGPETLRIVDPEAFTGCGDTKNAANPGSGVGG